MFAAFTTLPPTNPFTSQNLLDRVSNLGSELLGAARISHQRLLRELRGLDYRWNMWVVTLFPVFVVSIVWPAMMFPLRSRLLMTADPV